jgi:hypothetical protein
LSNRPYLEQLEISVNQRPQSFVFQIWRPREDNQSCDMT